MAKFLYSMQNVLDIKERLETQAKTEYAEMNNRLFIEEETMKRLGKRLDSYENLARSSASERLDIMEMRRCNEAIDIIKNQMTQQAVRIRIAQRNVDNAMKKLTEAVQDRKIHEKLKEKAGVSVYNLGTGNGYSVLDMVKAFSKACGKEIPYQIKPRRAGDIATCYCDASKAKEELHWVAERDLNKMCEDSWRWQSMNPNGYED